MERKPTVTIGIPAYNEEANIGRLLKALLEQSESSYHLEGIIIASDNSSDKTIQKAKELNDKRIEMIKGRRRMGKTGRVNQIFKITNSDISVILDADILPRKKTLIDNLIRPILSDSRVFLTSGTSLPMKPDSRFQKIIYTGQILWDKLKYSSGSEMYRCTGQIRAFRDRLYKEIIFPKKSSEDVYPYLYCVSKGYKFQSVKKATVYYSLPSKFKDFYKQKTRNFNSKKIQLESFDKDLVDSHFDIGDKQKITYFIKNWSTSPVYLSIYAVVLLILKFTRILNGYGNSPTWDISKTTKTLGRNY